MTQPPQRALPRWVSDVPLAHRGLWSDGAPENSLAAFAAARDAGCGVELDVQLTADGVPVVLHDADLSRVAGVDDAVSALPLAALREHALADGSPIPTLAEVLDVLGDAPTMVELKNSGRTAGVLEPPTADVLDGHLALAGTRAYVASFHPGSLAWFRRHRPQVLRAQTALATLDPRVPAAVGRAMAAMAMNGRSLPHLISYEVTGLQHPAVRRWRARGGVVITWTVREPDHLDLAAAGADNVIFERIDVPVWPRAEAAADS